MEMIPQITIVEEVPHDPIQLWTRTTGDANIDMTSPIPPATATAIPNGTTRTSHTVQTTIATIIRKALSHPGEATRKCDEPKYHDQP
jgi:hypothetical protein